MIWKLAWQTGQMKLELQVLSFTPYKKVPLPQPIEDLRGIFPSYLQCGSQYYNDVAKHQKARLAVLHVNKEARTEALRHLSLIENQINMIVPEPSLLSISGKVNRGARVIVDWANDVIFPQSRQWILPVLHTEGLFTSHPACSTPRRSAILQRN